MTFDAVDLAPELKAVVAELGFTDLTPVQERTLPLLLADRDVVGQARTGSGKTVAFALPILQKLDLETRAVQALILCPTRELSAQVAREIRRLGRRHPGLQVLVLAGGEPARPQREALERGVHIAVGTPGRILDLGMRGSIDLEHMRTLVLDEADRMLDMGFSDEVKAIIDETPSTRQTVFFSATYPEQIREWSRKYQQKPEIIKIAEPATETAAIRHLFFDVTSASEKPVLLMRLLKSVPGPAIVFCNFKASIADVVARLEQEDVSAAALHGDLEQRDRDRVLAMFRNGSRRVLVASDVAARGLDIAGLSMVVHYEIPHEAAVYTHRSGRTGRAGESGLAISLASFSERSRIRSEFGVELEKADFVELRKSTSSDAGVSREAAPAAMKTLYISGGRKEKVRPGDILGALTGKSGGFNAAQIGKIEIHDKFAYVAVDAKIAERAAAQLKSGGIKGRKFLVKLVE